MMKKSGLAGWLIIIAYIILSFPAYGMEPIDRIIAVVGTEPIMASELAAQIQMLAVQGQIDLRNQQDLERIQGDILNQMISERLFLIAATADTNIKVTDDEIDRTLEDHIAQLVTQFGGDEAFFSQLAAEGLDLRAYKKKIFPEIKNQLLKQKIISSKLASISISQQEVAEFFEQYRDSIPEQPAAIRLAHILITFQPSGHTDDSIKALAESVRALAAQGDDFTALAVKYSSGPAASSGGDLGFVSRGDVVEDFGRTAFNLRPGDISGLVRSGMGYHIIKCLETKDDKAHLQHILFHVQPTAFDSSLSYKLVDSLLTEIKGGADFKELAKVLSADDDTRKQGGELGWLAIKNMPEDFVRALEEIPEIGDVYGPVHSEFGLHIIKKLEWQEERILTLEDDYDQIREIARQSKTGEFVDNWLKEIREKTYVEINL